MQWRIGSQEFIPRIDDFLAAPVEFVQQSKMWWAQCDMGGCSSQEAYVMARAVAKVISQHYDAWLMRIFRQQYAYLSRSERRLMLDRVMALLQGEGQRAAQERMDGMAASLTVLLWAHDSLVIEGVEDFALSDVRTALIDLAGQAIDEYFAEQEYRQFIGFLKDYVRQQSPQSDVLHVRCWHNEVNIANSDGVDVGREIIEALSEDLDDGEDTRQELVVSALVLLAPEEVVLHGEMAPDLQAMLCAIFEGRVKAAAGRQL